MDDLCNQHVIDLLIDLLLLLSHHLWSWWTSICRMCHLLMFMSNSNGGRSVWISDKFPLKLSLNFMQIALTVYLNRYEQNIF